MLWGFRTMKSNHHDCKSRRLPSWPGPKKTQNFALQIVTNIEVLEKLGFGKNEFIENELY